MNITQLKTLLAFKKRKDDKRFSHLKKAELLLLWKEWKHRHMEVPAFENEIVQSVTEPSIPTVVTETEVSDQITANVQEV